jgi:hypothetical protein
MVIKPRKELQMHSSNLVKLVIVSLSLSVLPACQGGNGSGNDSGNNNGNNTFSAAGRDVNNYFGGQPSVVTPAEILADPGLPHNLKTLLEAADHTVDSAPDRRDWVQLYLHGTDGDAQPILSEMPVRGNLHYTPTDILANVGIDNYIDSGRRYGVLANVAERWAIAFAADSHRLRVLYSNNSFEFSARLAVLLGKGPNITPLSSLAGTHEFVVCAMPLLIENSLMVPFRWIAGAQGAEAGNEGIDVTWKAPPGGHTTINNPGTMHAVVPGQVRPLTAATPRPPLTFTPADWLKVQLTDGDAHFAQR